MARKCSGTLGTLGFFVGISIVLVSEELLRFSGCGKRGTGGFFGFTKSSDTEPSRLIVFKRDLRKEALEALRFLSEYRACIELLFFYVSFSWSSRRRANSFSSSVCYLGTNLDEFRTPAFDLRFFSIVLVLTRPIEPLESCVMI